MLVMNATRSLDECFYGAATVGDRGQVVIPAEARKAYGINPGDKVLVMGHPMGHGIMMCKIDQVRDALSDLLGEIGKIESEAHKEENQ